MERRITSLTFLCRYNAPEVANQRVEPIPPEQLHKCDIWAFGLCVWEILADGKKYFEFSSGSNHIYERPPPYSDTRSTGTSPSTPISHIDPLDEANQPTLDLFDHSKLENLGVEFVEGLEIPGLGFEKGMLRPLLKCTLQTDPSKRLSDLTRLPVIGLWNRTPGRHSLQSKLATYAFSGDIRYSIFSRGEGPHIIWEQQQQLLQEFEAEAQRAQPEKDHGRAAFQTMLCYVNAFGTSANLAKASLSFRGAKDAGHMIACVLEPRMLDGLTQSLSNYRREYSECLALGFNIVGKSEKGSSIDVHRGDSVTRFENYSSFRDILLSETGDASDTDGIDLMRITRNSSSGHFHPLEFAVQHGDLDLVKALLPGIAKSSVLETGNELLLVQAASRGHGAIVSCLLRAGAPIFHDKSTSLLHWLFCLDKSTLDDVRSYLQERPQSPGFRTSLNKVCSEKVSIHAQWPFQVQGTPLATAIASGHVAAVKALLALQADPLSPAFGASESDLVPGFTPIHLAIQYNSPEMLQLLWQAAFGEDVTTGARLYTEDSLGTFPIACALSLLTNAERFAVHGSAHKENMRNTIKLLSFDILLQSSPEGNNALAHAIDLEDADGVELLLEHCPMLASRKLGDPDNEALFTYQFHFAVQIGSNRDTDESIQILESILKLDPTAINRPDSSSVKPLHIAAMGTFTRTTEFLLDHGASCQDIDGSGQGPLHFCRNASNVTLLLSNGANIDHKDQLGFTATHAAAKHGKEEVLRTLVNAGANLSVKDNENGTPLHRAIHQKSRSMVEILINAGAEVNATNIFGQTPLLVAMETGQRALVTLLIDQDMDPFAEDERGLSPFCLSLAWRTPDILSKFQTHRKFSTLSWEKKIHVLYFASTKGEPAALKQYLSKLPAPSLEPNNPQGPYIQRMILAIHKAAVALRVDLVNVLLSGGFNVNSLDNNGNTPLLRVCQTGRENVDFYTYPRTYMCQIYSKTELISLRRIIWALHLLLLPKNVQIIR